MKRLQGVNGLIRMPEGEGQERGDLYTTALYSEALGSYLLAADNANRTVREALTEQTTTDLPTLWSALKLIRAAGATFPAELEARLANGAIPARQQDVDAEIAALWFWIDVGRMQGWSAIVGKSLAEEALVRLGAIDVNSITDKPYLLWRVFDSYSALQKQKPSELERALKNVDSKKLPGDYESTLDFQAALEARATLGKDLVVPNDAKDHIVGLLDSSQVHDDALIASMLRSLELLNAQTDAQRLIKDRVAPRVDQKTGLIRSATLAKGSVLGTYLAARLLDTSFPEVASERTRHELERVLKAPEIDLITQLKALLALKRSGSSSWESYGAVIERGRAALPVAVTFANLTGYIELVDVLVQLEPSVRLGRLEAFDADPGVEDLLSGALMALSNSMYFSNSEEVRLMFPGVQSALPQLIGSPKEKSLNYFRALTAMTNASRSGLGSNDFDKAAEGLLTLKGCKEFSSLYRMEADKASPCSLSLSAAMIAVPGAYDFGENK
ncbi:hypothetical protein [Arthrobacter sp. B2a2-09]|uniref:hypothetical protein n=1 Tax=Arthrobacter sp. B2a2-09 TaxID=2952822 RepID=UPI0022CD5A69|nr:hypothetical protein [Arthrobacter sp. B2a2-09]MCZ9883012.1 hypothetical protein [Arthrobacter sp. B2a2-09]